jgi:hypothetical protein
MDKARRGKKAVEADMKGNIEYEKGGNKCRHGDAIEKTYRRKKKIKLQYKKVNYMTRKWYLESG